ncbi:MAG: hypothetical protein AAGU12_04115 [Clostridiales bacterium]
MKRFSAISVLILIFLLAACGSSAQNTGQTNLSQPTQGENRREYVTDLEITLTIPFEGHGMVEISGIYTGEIVNGLPSGTGEFGPPKGASGKTWLYRGEFKDGLYNGYGENSFIAANGEIDYVKRGNFTEGVFTPTKGQWFDSLSTQFLHTKGGPSKSLDFIDENENLFPCVTDEDEAKAISLTDTEVEYKHLIKNISNYLGTIVHVPIVKALQVNEITVNGRLLTRIFARDKDGNSYYIFVDGEIDIYDEDVVEIYGLPLVSSYFDNIRGGYINVVALVASIIRLI